MIQIPSLIAPHRVLCKQSIASKKRALEQLSQLFELEVPEFDAHRLFEALMSRERLGSTGLGEGIGLPHARVAGLTEPCAALMTLEEGIDYDAPDHKPVSTLVCLLIPEGAENDHLQILRLLATGFQRPALREQIQQAATSEALQAIIAQWPSDEAASNAS